MFSIAPFPLPGLGFHTSDFAPFASMPVSGTPNCPVQIEYGIFIPPKFKISGALLGKATRSNPTLTTAERNLLLSHLDLPGNALAFPDSITPAQRDIILARIPAHILNPALQKASEG